ncbi:MAG: OsmC family protein [Saprospirales bacterium]|nr:OsmC family protein [Saprospirales bacterium]MBK8922575.1 OsmC family protein [Saprospirales bacterium]
MSTILSGAIGADHYRATLHTGRHQWHADEKSENGGADTAPTPSELLLSALAACKLITLRMYADRKEWPVTRISIELEMDADYAARPARTHIRCRLHAEGVLDEEQRQRLVAIADKCPTHRLLTGELAIESVWGT